MPAGNARDRGGASQVALIICDSPEFHEEIEHGLVQSGYKAVTADADAVDFEQVLKKHRPAVVIVSLSEPDNAALANLQQFSEPLKYALIWYGEAADEAEENAQVLGATGLLFHPPTTEQVRTMLSFARSQAERMRDYQSQIAKLQDDLETRKLVDRARGIVMQQMNLTEEEAYHLLRRESRRQRKPMKEISQAVIMAQGFLTGAKGGQTEESDGDNN